MPNYNTTDTSPVFACGYGNRVEFDGVATVTAALGIGDKVRICKIPAGTKVDRVVIKTGDMDSGTTLTDKIGWEPLDGSVVSGADVAFCASGATTRQAPALTTYEIFPPVVVKVDSWLTLQCVTAAAGQAGNVDVAGKVEGVSLGAK